MRPGSFGENGFGFGEPELDANTALTELDKGLRSIKIGEQVEAIVRFPALFERYPFPILINSAFLKLADVFRTGSNFLRLWVLRVCQQSERHLDKILNVDEFIRRIFSVIYANDPIARALTLRTMGSLSGLISEKKPVHHSIRVALDSHDRVEVSAAICAASCFARRSKTFGTTMCMKIASMVQRLSTPIDLKLRLIPIFQHMHHDVATASMVRKLCQDLLVHYPSMQFVTTILHTLTQLAASTISDLTEQVSFLLSYLEDSRLQVKLCVLKDLKFLGERGGHLWEPNHISILINSIINQRTDQMETDTPDPLDAEIVHTGLDVINSVTSSSAILSFVHSSESSFWRLLETSIHSTDMTIALKAIQIATYIAINWRNEELARTGISLVEMASSGVESLLISLCSQTLDGCDENFRNELFTDLEKCLSYGVLLCKADSSKCDWYCSLLIRLFKIPETSARSRNLLCQGVGSIGSYNLESVQKVLPEIINILKKMDKETIEAENSTVATLVAVIFQAHQGHTLVPKTTSTLRSIIHSSNLWLAYRLARNSLRYGQPEIATLALKGMSAKVSSESFHFWLSSLHSVASAERVLTDTENTPRIISRLNQASNLYMQSVSSLKAASSPTMSLQFQIEYLRIRSEMLVAFSNFLVSCNTLQLSPPAAIAASIAVVMRDELLKSGRVVTQLRKSIRDFLGISEMYSRLYQTAFDADNDSLLNIQILQQMCRLVARAIEKQVVSKDHPSFSDDDQSVNFFMEMTYTNSSYSWSLVQSCKNTIEILHSMSNLPPNTVSYQQIECLREATRILIETPLPYPRFFFQTLQMTRVKIAVSPQPRNAGESVTVMHGNNLALKVEGVIQQNGTKASDDDSKSPTVFRKPKAIRLTVVSTPLPNPRAHMVDHSKLNLEPITLVKDVVPHRDFFQSQFLLLVAPGGLTNVSVDTSLVDFEGRLWQTGPRCTLSVRVFDEPGVSKQNLPAAQIQGPSRQPPQPGMMPPGNQPIMPPRY